MEVKITKIDKEVTDATRLAGKQFTVQRITDPNGHQHNSKMSSSKLVRMMQTDGIGQFQRNKFFHVHSTTAPHAVNA